ncbi:MAG: DUF1292 domain-containing protein [Lachnospiraceae bacterium]|nr:DUF1292 domain-containing protein [Lachnospiraceae bacterium]
MNEDIKNAMEDSDVMVTLELEDGSTLPCEILTIFDIGEQSYIVLEPQDEVYDEETDEYEIYVYRYFEDEDDEDGVGYHLENIEDDDEYERVAERLDELMDEIEFEEM